MIAILTHRRKTDGVEFRVEQAGKSLPAASWARQREVQLATERSARLGPLLLLLEDGVAVEAPVGVVGVPFVEIARLSDSERVGLGIPASRSLLLEIRGSGALSDPGFRVEKRLLHPDGRPMVPPRRAGCFLDIGGQEATLAEPLYSIVVEIDRFNEAGFTSLDERFLAWARVAAHLPEEVKVDAGLRNMRILFATAFTVNPFRNEQGEADFDPLPGRWVDKKADDGSKERVFEPVLGRAAQDEFAGRFRSLSHAKSKYALSGATYVMFPKSVETALETVHAIQKAAPGERRRFLTQPSAHLRQALEDARDSEPTEEDLESLEQAVDEVFFDEGLSERVRGIGLWQPKVLPWLKQATDPWLPPEEMGIRVGDELVPIPLDQVTAAAAAVAGAMERGEETVDVCGHTLPATSEVLDALRELERLAKEKKKAPPADSDLPPPPGPPEDRFRLVLQITDNLEVMGFRRPPRGEYRAAAVIPASLQTGLLEHQKEGLRWLQEHWCTGSPGALLADDMGLGKTLQALAFLAWVREEMAREAYPRRPILVVAPTGLIRNWLAEHERHFVGAGVGRPIEAVGARLRELRSARDSHGRELQTALPSLDVARLQDADWVLTTYESLRDYQHSFGRIHWAATVFDEVQKIKNPATALTESAKAMKQDFVITMTGTPVENRIEDLWCIGDTTAPGSFKSLKEFSATYASEKTEPRDLEQLQQWLVRGATPPIMLRRLKEDHLEGLPEKHLHQQELEMPPEQAAAYDDVVKEGRAGGDIISVLHRLRSVSLHPFPAPMERDDSRYIAASARLTMAFQILDEVKKRGEKALLFIESREMQATLSELIPARYGLSEPVLIVNGAVAGPVRMQRVDRFQERNGFDVMLLSPRAGGVGFTATAASHVIHLSRWWNPAVEDQCTDRAYRIGQERSVHVYVLLARHPNYGDRSFDCNLDRLLERKRALNRSVLLPPAMSSEDRQSLFDETIG